VDVESKISWLKQTWRIKQGLHSKLPKSLKEMLKTAEKFNIRIQARKADRQLKENMTAWHNVLKPKDNYKWNKKASNPNRYPKTC
jgi:hypothetical protein